MRAAGARAVGIFESVLEQTIRLFFKASHFIPAILSRGRLIILQGVGVVERFYPESDPALESRGFLEPEARPERPRVFQTLHSCD